jgi:hypothetical protein
MHLTCLAALSAAVGRDLAEVSATSVAGHRACNPWVCLVIVTQPYAYAYVRFAVLLQP